MLETSTDTTFSDIGIDQDLVDTLAKDGILHPFRFQIVAIPDALAGFDVTGKAQTRSGKTLAFGLPLAQRLKKAQPQRPRGLILVPTRELANQVTEVIEPLVRVRGISSGSRSTAAFPCSARSTNFAKGQRSSSPRRAA